MKCDFISLVKIPAAINAKLANRVILAGAKILKLKNNYELAVLISSPAYIRHLNSKYRKKNKVTDVLSFSQKEGLKLPGQKDSYLGDIVICFDRIKSQAKKFNHSAEKEFVFILAHGFLHLLGYQDDTNKQYQKMAKIQNEILAKIYGKI